MAFPRNMKWALVWGSALALCSAQSCLPYVNMPGGDLSGMPLSGLTFPTQCRQACITHPACALYTFVAAPSPHANCSGGACCWLKSDEVSGKAPVVWDQGTCSEWVRTPNGSSSTAARNRPNVLWVLVDDLRPDLEPYGQQIAATPAIARLADSGTVFDNAYCQIAVCSPSRLSFLSSRRPDHAGMYNFINHIRQSDCGASTPDTAYSGPDLVPPINTGTTGGGCQWGGAAPCGGSGQCCSLCTQHANCTAWSYTAPLCHLKGPTPGGAVHLPGTVSGRRGTESHSKWTTVPEHFKKSGYFTLQAGKVFHTEEGGTGNGNPELNGPGMPPNSDPRSWHLAMPQVNAVAQMWGLGSGEEEGVPASLEGVLNSTGPQEHQLADRVIAQDAVLKLRLAAANRAATGQPFLLAAGFRKPHLPFRFPAPYLKKLPPKKSIPVAAHRTLHSSVPSIAHCDEPPQDSPWHPPDNQTAQSWRLHYYSAIAWVDHQIGVLLQELEDLDRARDTLVVLHSDHGWSLGEHGEWQKFSNFEHGTRVPLIMRAPWLPQSVGARTAVLAELVDVGPTMWGLAGLAPPVGEHLDGVDLSSVLKAPHNVPLAQALKPHALSQYMRCPANMSVPWKNNDCLFVDRALLSVMGYTLRTAQHRYTEWRRWNGSSLAAVLEPEGLLGTELYSHAPQGRNYSFDLFENRNEAQDSPEVVQSLAAVLHQAIQSQTRVPSLSPWKPTELVLTDA